MFTSLYIYYTFRHLGYSYPVLFLNISEKKVLLTISTERFQFRQISHLVPMSFLIHYYSCLFRVREAFVIWLKRGRYTTDYVMPQQICVMFNVIAQAKKQVRFRL